MVSALKAASGSWVCEDDDPGDGVPSLAREGLQRLLEARVGPGNGDQHQVRSRARYELGIVGSFQHLISAARQRALQPFGRDAASPSSRMRRGSGGSVTRAGENVSRQQALSRKPSHEFRTARRKTWRPRLDPGRSPDCSRPAAAIGATALQLFTKTPNQWREPTIDAATRERFREEMERTGMRAVVSHDSYLINLASPDPPLNDRSVRSFIAELQRAEALGLSGVVSHPGNYMDNREAGLIRNAANYARCLEQVPGQVMVLLETTAGTGTALGRSFEELAELRERIPEPHRARIGFCADTCHLYSAGYDLVHDYDGVWELWERIIGLRYLHCLHLNDSKDPVRLPPRPPRTDRRWLPRPRAVSADHARSPAWACHPDHRDPEGR